MAKGDIENRALYEQEFLERLQKANKAGADDFLYNSIKKVKYAHDEYVKRLAFIKDTCKTVS